MTKRTYGIKIKRFKTKCDSYKVGNGKKRRKMEGEKGKKTKKGKDRNEGKDVGKKGGEEKGKEMR